MNGGSIRYPIRLSTRRQGRVGGPSGSGQYYYCGINFRSSRRGVCWVTTVGEVRKFPEG
jgi:hypothetical protein